jgi:hypothetical protein
LVLFFLKNHFEKLLIKSKFETHKNKLEESVPIGVAAIEKLLEIG